MLSSASLPMVTSKAGLTVVSFRNSAMYFSYATLIAFRVNGDTYLSKNYWGGTTGRHLNSVDPDASKRLDREAFAAKYNELFPM